MKSLHCRWIGSILLLGFTLVSVAASDIMQRPPNLRGWLAVMDASLQVLKQRAFKDDGSYYYGIAAAAQSGNRVGMVEARFSGDGGGTRLTITDREGRTRAQREFPQWIGTRIEAVPGGWIIAGQLGDPKYEITPNGVWAAKVSTDGDTLWSFETRRGQRGIRFKAAGAAPDGSVLIVADSVDYDYRVSQPLVFKIAQDGRLEWELRGKMLSGSFNCTGCVALPGQGWLLSGRTAAWKEDSTTWLRGISADGKWLDARHYPQFGDDVFSKVILLADGSILTTVPGQGEDVWLLTVLKLHPNGDEIWSRTLRLKPVLQSPFVSGAAELSDHRLLLATGGNMLPGSGGALFMLGATGDSLLSMQISDMVRSIVPLDNGRAFLAGGRAVEEKPSKLHY